MIHIPTAFTILCLAHAACALVMWLVWRRSPHIPGVKEWAIGRGILVASILIFAIRNDVNLVFSVVAGNGLLFLADYYIWLGFVKFQRRSYPRAQKFFIWLLVIMLAVLAYLSLVPGSYPLRALISSAGISFYAVMCIAALSRRSGEPKYFVAKLLIISYLCLVFAHMTRIVFYSMGYGTGELYNANLVTGYVIAAETFIAIITNTGCFVLVMDVLQQELKQTADRDDLTGAYNRKAFFTIINNLMARAKRDCEPVSVLSIDLDKFKKINDTYGHQTGDRVLKRFAEETHKQLRSHDIHARFGGEEFIVYLPATRAVDAVAIAERIRSNLTRAFLDRELSAGQVTCSIGVASVKAMTDDISIDDLIAHSDKALYKSKKRGRNCVTGDEFVSERAILPEL